MAGLSMKDIDAMSQKDIDRLVNLYPAVLYETPSPFNYHAYEEKERGVWQLKPDVLALIVRAQTRQFEQLGSTSKRGVSRWAGVPMQRNRIYKDGDVISLPPPPNKPLPKMRGRPAGQQTTLSDWQKYVKAHKGTSLTIKELAQMYRNKKKPLPAPKAKGKAKKAPKEAPPAKRGRGRPKGKATKLTAYQEYQRANKGLGLSRRQLAEFWATTKKPLPPVPTKAKKAPAKAKKAPAKAKKALPNPWIQFVKNHRGKGYNLQELSAMYKKKQ